MYCLEEVAMIEKVQETHLYKWLCEKNSEFLGQVNEAIRYAENMLPLISKVFSDYTVHGIRHSINVMEYMFSLITDIDLLSELEVVLLIYGALFHDIGMVTNENEINDIKSDNSVLGERKYSKVFEKYKAVKEAYYLPFKQDKENAGLSNLFSADIYESVNEK